MNLDKFSRKELNLLLELIKEAVQIENEMNKFKYRGLIGTLDKRKYYELMKVKIQNHFGDYDDIHK